jgi:hypothetical protein
MDNLERKAHRFGRATVRDDSLSKVFLLPKIVQGGIIMEVTIDRREQGKTESVTESVLPAEIIYSYLN